MTNSRHAKSMARFTQNAEAMKALVPQQADPKYIVQSNGRYSPLLTHMMTKRTTPAPMGRADKSTAR